MEKLFFTEKLFEWFATHHRPMPWKGEKNPYYIWLSEIILQQTTVRQGLPYYQKFVEQYPSVHELANAPEDDVMKLWEGLGYYSRARNLHATAKHISNDLNGLFPTSYEGLLTLKGVGSYTAAAIASFAFDLPHAVVDGNVYRVLSRYFGIEDAIDTPQSKRYFTDLANELLDRTRAADFNQAMMDFGATHCTPAKPLCVQCLLKNHCVAFKERKVEILPVKSKKIEKKERFFNYLVINAGENTFIKKREDKDIWQNLYEFPLIETENLIDNLSNTGGVPFKNKIRDWLNTDYKIIKKSAPFKQLLTHRKIIAVFWEIEVSPDFYFSDENMMNIKIKNLTKFAFPKVMSLYFQDKSLTLF